MSNAKNKGISGVLAAIGTLVSAAGAAEKDDEEARKAAPPESDDPEKENPEEEKRDDEEADDAEKAEEEGAAEKSARAAEKARIRDILGAPAAKGREATAQALALDTEISAAEVVAVLERIPRAACVPRALASAMETHKPPVIGTGPSGDDDHAAATIAQRIAGYVNVRRAR